MKLNRVELTGNLTRDVESKMTQTGMQIVEGTLASGYSYKKGEKWIDDPAYVDFVAFGKMGEKLAAAKKGQALLLAGRLRTEQWEKEGKKLSKLRLIVEFWEKIEKQEYQKTEKSTAASSESTGLEESSIPF